TREWHLTAATPAKTKTAEFVSLYRPHRSHETVPDAAELRPMDGGYVLRADLTDGHVIALLPTQDTTPLTADGLTTTGAILLRRFASDGSTVGTQNVPLK
ncbi:MAG: hypothetical protein JW829_07265, partial [Pirellulales bacterium]|nr:hypothetical protein [Pirellulales bacterium]